ncbi:MAG: hypothetical protein ACJ8C4_12000 [Gemmataceae bacterium]
MTRRSLFRLEQLENRWCPAVTARLALGTLTISGTPAATLSIVQDSTTAGKIQVFDGVTPVTGSPFTGVNNLRLSLGTSADTVAIDLGGKTLPGYIVAALGAGANNLSVINGAATRVSIGASNDDDSVTLGDGISALTLQYADVSLTGGSDTVTLKNGTTLSKDFSAFYVNDVTLEAGASTRNFYVRGGTTGNAIDISGTVTGNLFVHSLYFFGASTAGTSLDVSGTVDGSVSFYGSDLADTVTLGNNVGRGATIVGYGGDDSISISGAVTNSLYIDGGDGDDSIDVSSTVGGRVYIYGGAGNDSLVIGAAAKFLTNAVVSMGSGADTVNLNNAASFTSLLINGGSGTDTFIGNKAATGLVLVSCEL